MNVHRKEIMRVVAVAALGFVVSLAAGDVIWALTVGAVVLIGGFLPPFATVGRSKRGAARGRGRSI